MADSSVAITPGSGAPIRVLTALGAGSADQQVISLADQSGNLLDVAKGTQGASGLATQDLKDSGRVACVFHNGGTGQTPTTTEAAISSVAVRDGVPATAANSQAVTSGKRLRLTSLQLTVQASTTTAASALVRIRLNTNGTAGTGSGLIAMIACTSAAVANNGMSQLLNFPDGYEISGTMQFCLTIQGVASGSAFVQLFGFEY